MNKQLSNSVRVFETVIGSKAGIIKETYNLNELNEAENDEVVFSIMEKIGIDTILDLKVGDTEVCTFRDYAGHILILRVK